MRPCPPPARSDALIEVGPRPGEECLRTEDIVAAIAAAGESLSLVLFSGVQVWRGRGGRQ
jgi:kynureninase